MRFWIDCEWNGYRGSLISMALVGEDGAEWYKVTHCPNPVEWVAQNVMPVLEKSDASLISEQFMSFSLSNFVMNYATAHVIADWPEDIARFCDLLIVGPGQRVQYPQITMEIANLRSESLVPHNALHDARAVKEAYLRKK